jgi:hypothetical protein
MTSPVFEVNKEFSVTSIMQLVDLNGSMLNFQTEFTIATKDPSKTVLVAIVNQNQLDNGEINFEPTENGRYSRRITYRENTHLNHFIALKKQGGGGADDESTIDCNIIIRLKEMEPRDDLQDNKDNKDNKGNKDKEKKMVSFKTPIEEDDQSRKMVQPQQQLAPPPSSNTPFRDNNDLQPNVRNQLTSQLANLRQSPEYYNTSDDAANVNTRKRIGNNTEDNSISSNKDNKDSDNNNNNNNDKNNNNNNNDKNKKRHYPPLSFSEKLQADPYYLVGIVSLVIFMILVYMKFAKR